ncbi:MAG TPA: methyltransferase domain-containing protein [Sedimentisphaerales bacterium]|nr:methyltransferase domain-containing protein [Sedimentisphaerales bacterium]
MKIKSSIQDGNLNNADMSVNEWWDYCQSNNSWYLTGSKGPEVWERLNIADKIRYGQVVLNIGVGLGYCTQELVAIGCTVHALDISEVALDRVRKMIAGTWSPTQLAQLPDSFFDLAISNLVTQHMNDEDLFDQMGAVIRSLKPDGIFAMQFAYSLSARYDLYKATSGTMKVGAVLRSLAKMNSFVEKAHGRILWVDKIGDFPEWNSGWYGVHIVRHDEGSPLLQDRSLENARNAARFFNADGEDLFNAGDADNAEAAFLHSVRLDPEFARPHNNLGVVYFQKSNHDLALKHFEKAMRLEPGNRLFVFNCGKLLKSLGMASETKDVYSDFLKIHPGDDEIRGLLKGLNAFEVTNLNFRNHQNSLAVKAGAGGPLDD